MVNKTLRIRLPRRTSDWIAHLLPFIENKTMKGEAEKHTNNKTGHFTILLLQNMKKQYNKNFLDILVHFPVLPLLL